MHVLDDLNRFGRETVTKLFQLGGIPFNLPDGMFCALFALYNYISTYMYNYMYVYTYNYIYLCLKQYSKSLFITIYYL